MILLDRVSVDLFADVHPVPRSRANPRCSPEMLASELAAAGIGYRHLPAWRIVPLAGGVMGSGRADPTMLGSGAHLLPDATLAYPEPEDDPAAS